MAAKVVLAPNPRQSGAIVRAIVIGASQDGSVVRLINLEAFEKYPDLLKNIGGGYATAAKFWNALVILIFIFGIFFSFYWHWWAFLVGLVIVVILNKSNRRSVADFLVDGVAHNSAALLHYETLGLVWETSADTVVPA